MAFTIEEIEKMLIAPMSEWGMHHSIDLELTKSVNYPVIVNYLTGQSSSLSGLQQDNKIYYWSSLVKLLHNIEQVSVNEQLVLDVIYEPMLFSYINYHFNEWLLRYALFNKTDKSLQGVLQQFRKQGMNDDAVFNYCVSTMNANVEAELDIHSTGLVNFLVNYIRQQSKLVLPSYGYSHWGNEWNLFYFKLLEEARPEFANEYSLYSIQSQGHNPATFFASYKEGKYLPVIISNLTNRQNHNMQTLESKFSFAIHLYETNPAKYQELIIEMSRQYLAHFSIHTPKKIWEHDTYLKEFEETDLSHLPYSSTAFHLLLQHEKENALQILNDWFQQKVFVQFRTLLVLHHHLKEDAFSFVELAMKGNAVIGGVDYIHSIVDLMQQKFEVVEYLPLVWDLTSSKSKPIRAQVAKVLAEKDAEAENKAIALLQNKNSETKQTAATILSYFTSNSSKEAIKKVLNTETNDNARDILLQTVADNLPTEASIAFIEDMLVAAKGRGKLNRPVEAWLDEAILPALFYATGKELTIDEKRFLLYRMSRIKEMKSDMEAKYILQFIDKEKSSEFAIAIIKLFIDKGAKPEHKWMMALAALLGNDTVVDKIRITINKWMEENRYKMAEHGVGALAIQGSDKALRWVEWYSRKYKSKKANVGAAALAALETAAEELGITIHELGDRVVPDFGFDGLFKNFTTDGEEYRAFIDSNFKMAFFNEDNKKLKAIPAATDATIKEEFKAVAKEVRDIVKSQSFRLEYYLIIQRKWSFQQWQQFFLRNPVMFIYATKLLWGVYNESGNLQQTFMCSEDTSLMDVNNEEINLDENSFIGIVHPTGLSEALLQQWQQQFYDLSVDPVFPQLDRKTPDLKNIDLSKPIIKVFEGKQMQTGSTKSTLERFGWHKGPTGDGGMLESFNLLYFEKKIEAVLEVDGIGAGYGWGMDEKLGRLYIIDKTKVTSKWGVYIKNEEDENLVDLSSVPIIFLSEMLAAVQAIKPFEKKD